LTDHTFIGHGAGERSVPETRAGRPCRRTAARRRAEGPLPGPGPIAARGQGCGGTASGSSTEFAHAGGLVDVADRDPCWR